MKRNKKNLSKAKSYLATGEYWDSHDLSAHWEETQPVQFDVSLEMEHSYFGVEKELSKRISQLAKKRGVSSNTMVNLLLQEQLAKAQ